MNGKKLKIMEIRLIKQEEENKRGYVQNYNSFLYNNYS